MPPAPPPAIPVLLLMPDSQLLQHLEQHAKRASGPGGQKVNKTASAVLLQYHPLGIQVSSQKHRSRQDNLKSALRRIRLELALAYDQEVGSPILNRIAPYLQNGLHIQDRNPELPFVYLAIAALFRCCGGDPKTTAQKLGVTPSALNRFCAKHKRLLETVNQVRSVNGQGILKTR